MTGRSTAHHIFPAICEPELSAPVQVLGNSNVLFAGHLLPNVLFPHIIHGSFATVYPV